MAELVRMRHDEIEHGDAELPITTRTAFDTVWADKGWKIDEDAPAPVDATESVEEEPEPTGRARKSTAAKG